MSTPQSCFTCRHWRRHRPESDYGECEKIVGIERTLAGNSKAYVFATFSCDPGQHLVVALHSHKTFECFHHEEKPQTNNSLIKTVQNASREAYGLPPKE